MRTIWTPKLAVLALCLAVSFTACRSATTDGTYSLESARLQELEQSRARMMEHLEAYAEKGSFPLDPEGSVVKENDPHYQDGTEKTGQQIFIFKPHFQNTQYDQPKTDHGHIHKPVRYGQADDRQASA